MNAPTRPILRYYGGKWRIAPWIISHFPGHKIYVEPFCGASSVFAQKKPACQEVINDMNGRIVNLFRVLRDQKRAIELKNFLELTPYAEEEYQSCRETSPDPVEDARRVIVLGMQGHGGTGASGGKLTGWRRDNGGNTLKSPEARGQMSFIEKEPLSCMSIYNLCE
ncbi:DNA adenine methylase [Candidatus Pacearchaeota archaeon]|nr:DNA adenine methylase [Candidatus Pacearchaeota archaeon]